jgi:hypothetical protein
MPIVVVECPQDGEPLEVSLEMDRESMMFNLATSPHFVEHMNAQHGGRMNPVTEWPPLAAAHTGV